MDLDFNTFRECEKVFYFEKIGELTGVKDLDNIIYNYLAEIEWDEFNKTEVVKEKHKHVIEELKWNMMWYDCFPECVTFATWFFRVAQKLWIYMINEEIDITDTILGVTQR